MMPMLRAFASLLCGSLFGFGLALSGMLDPMRVRGFLDVSGRWDPRLAFVLAGAVATSMLGIFLARRLKRPVFGGAFERPSRTSIDARLLGGAAMFGVGWGLSGLCPGPALALLLIAPRSILIFNVAMLVGMLFERFLTTRSSAELTECDRSVSRSGGGTVGGKDLQRLSSGGVS